MTKELKQFILSCTNERFWTTICDDWQLEPTSFWLPGSEKFRNCSKLFGNSHTVSWHPDKERGQNAHHAARLNPNENQISFNSHFSAHFRTGDLNESNKFCSRVCQSKVSTKVAPNLFQIWAILDWTSTGNGILTGSQTLLFLEINCQRIRQTWTSFAVVLVLGGQSISCQTAKCALVHFLK